jgi:UDP-2,3-diacylglucosamine hydrolase
LNADALQSGFVVSDLHLFTHRSEAMALVRRMRAAAAQADFGVLNGDIFDFRWTNLASLEKTAQAAVDWLGDLARSFPHCQWFYIMGNHDGLAFFAPYLDELAEDVENFQWRPSHLRVGDSLFLHGDLPLDPGWRDPLNRALRSPSRKKGRILNLAYRLYIRTGLHRTAASVFRPRLCARRILRSLRAYHTDLADGIRHVYFGHTHRTFSNFQYGGLTFHNTGSAIQGLRCDLLTVKA